ncbi:uncharacterized protein LOC116107868 [Pistacia vera]|uniref:uncharacterized protein LOC116107868 n=1 Tax=Pistacia vera TaxID=55513 RepID=UPI0012635552|nr:uncharacterized protein LOC116107868 [Pistacia vera]
MFQLEGFVNSQYPQHVCKLTKALYGLKQAPRAWFDKLKHAFLISSLFKSIYKKEDQVLYVLVYVDDIFLTRSNAALVQEIIHKLNKQFALKTLGSLKYFLGFEVTRTESVLHMNQEKYAKDLLVKTSMLDSKPFSTPMVVGTKLVVEDNELFDKPGLYRSTIGALQYLTLTRLDIAYFVNKLSQFLKAPTQLHWQACKRLLRYIKGTLTHGIQFHKVDKFNLECYTDDWASSVQDRRSTSGCCLILGPNLLQWSSHKQKVVALSSTEAEYRALAQGATEVAWFRSLFS